MDKAFLGIDTSNYKTSLAVIDERGNILLNISEYLDVPLGQKGLRQSDAFFKHSCRLPDIIENLSGSIEVSKLAGIGVSSRPRRVEGSYMPCFLAGVNAARELGSVLGIPVKYFSHQEGHAAAIIETSAFPETAESLLIHLSGGTTEILLCRQSPGGYELRICGGTLDISAGQLIDRVGVALGLPFPSGAYLDSALKNYSGEAASVLPAIRVKDGFFNLSGTETAILRQIEKLKQKAVEESRAVTEADYIPYIKELFIKIADTLSLAASRLTASEHTDTVFMAGGVSSSSFIRDRLNALPDTSGDVSASGIRYIFGRPELSGDNAVGIAILTERICSAD